MGVSYLKSFIKHNGNILRSVKFSNSKLIIDGTNLYNMLFFKARLDERHGGDYDDFKDQVCKFFKALRDCDITPYVIIDGGSDSTDRKFDTLQKRAQSTIKKAKALAESQNQVSGVLPTLVKYVFKQVLSSLNVPFTQCLCEADQCIASLAQIWNCPVLSDDSDFYIFDIQAGCLPMSGFKWQYPFVSAQKRIRCQRYTTERFSEEFKINKQLLPVFAVMAGNDNVNLHIWWGDNEDKPQIVNRQVKQAANRFPTFKRLLKWLASFNELREALDSVPSLITHQKSDALSKGIEEYQIPPTLPSYLEEFFNNGVAPSRKCLPDHLSVLPDWTVLLLMKGRLSSCIVNVLLHKRMIHRFQVEDFGRPSGYTTSLYIRQVLYGLLLVERPAVKEDDSKGQKRAHPSSQSPPEVYVEEYDREDTELVRNKAPESVRLEVFLETLGVSQSTLNGLPPHLELPVAVTCYWLRRARPRPDRPLLQALLLGLVYGQNQSGFIEEGPVLERLRGLKPDSGADLDLGVAHAYSQWQCCMRDGLDLNQLLCFPLPEPQCAWLYRGTLVHQLVAELRQGMNPDSLLMEDPPSLQLNSKLIIDGTNLYNNLYFEAHLDERHGGDYDDFKDQVCKFFKALRDCDITPYVIIDGGSDSTDRKFDTLQKRAQSTIKKAKALAETQIPVRGVLPTLVKYVFKQVLSSLNVPFTQCLCEADQCIASLAQKWKCPVLSDDSDFYIFDIKKGCLPISGFQWKEQSVSDQKHICCQHYTTERFSEEFKINKQLLPVFAVMAGNDNVNLHIWWGDNEDKPQIVNRQVKQVADRFPTFKRLLKWLASFNELREALDSVPSLIKRPMSDALSKGIEEYQIPPTLPSYLEEFFNNGVAPSRKCLPDHLSVLPDWTVLLLMKGRLSSCIVNVLLHKRMIHRVQVEDSSRPSGYTTSLCIRQVFYGLLLVERPAVKEDDSKGQKRADPSSQSPPEVYVEEYVRKDTELVRNESTLNGLPRHLRLPVAVTCYWLRRARPRPDRPLLQALLLGLVYGQSQSEEGPVLERLRGLKPDSGADLDLGVAHAYNQWQCCMREGLNLNQLLCFPLPEPQCAWLYRGTLVHQLVAELRRGVNPDSLLMEDPPSVQLYKSMMENLKDDCKDTGGSRKANPEDDQVLPSTSLSLSSTSLSLSSTSLSLSSTSLSLSSTSLSLSSHLPLLSSTSLSLSSSSVLPSTSLSLSSTSLSLSSTSLSLSSTSLSLSSSSVLTSTSLSLSSPLSPNSSPF
ncbi:unnamed protein product [Coregonus sp. 'balchen']|nr:unnamed protein product [Coregonus sp. 'balchen']